MVMMMIVIIIMEFSPVIIFMIMIFYNLESDQGAVKLFTRSRLTMHIELASADVTTSYCAQILIGTQL